jgi:heme exporter protein A
MAQTQETNSKQGCGTRPYGLNTEKAVTMEISSSDIEDDKTIASHANRIGLRGSASRRLRQNRHMSALQNKETAPFAPLSLHVERLNVRRDGRLVLQNVSFELHEGEALLVTGTNGVGKSTLLRALCGLLALESGLIRIQSNEEEPASFIHYQGHLDALKPTLTVRENLAFWQAFYGGDGLDSSAALNAFDIEHLANIPAGFCSQGQKRRVALSRLLVSKRPIWLLDEPTAALDMQSQSGLLGIIEKHRAQGGMVIIATHQALELKQAKTLHLLPPEQDAISDPFLVEVE